MRSIGTWTISLVLGFVLGPVLASGCDGPDVDRARGLGEVAQGLEASVQADREVVAIARTQGPAMLARIPAGLEAGYGFGSRAEFMRVVWGAPWRVRTWSPAVIRTANLAELPEPQALSVWRVPAVVDGKARALVTVARVDGALRVVEVGAAGLAAELDALGLTASGHTHSLLRIFQLKADFALLGAERKIVALHSGRKALRLPAADDPRLSAAALVSGLARALEQHAEVTP